MIDRPLKSNIDSVKTEFELANALLIQGELATAFIHYQATLQLCPEYFPAYQQLGNLMLRQRRMDEALEYYDRALSLDFEATDLSLYYQCLDLPKQQSNQLMKSANISFPIDQLNQVSTGKINLGTQKMFGHHRSGWDLAIQALSPLHNSQGILFDSVLENQFSYENNRAKKRSPRILAKMQADGAFQILATLVEKGILPYQKPWVGFLHHPPLMPNWFMYYQSPQKLWEKEIWQASLPHCVGLFTLTNYFAEWLRAKTDRPVSVLTLPTEIPDKQFDFDQFIANPQKKIVQIGWWLRKLHSIYQLPLARNNPLGYEKVRTGFLFESSESLLAQLMKLEARTYKIELDEAYQENTTIIPHIPNDEYDDFLSKNIAFLDLYDSSSNNAIVECIARATPLLINPLPGVKEYLGDDYPMYFHTLEEAAAKALDISLILETHQYLLSCNTRKKLSADYFLKSFCSSEVYRSI
jgi:tetratricopeptide (TPR) repeat protein